MAKKKVTKKQNRKPTARQKRAVKILVENGGKSVSAAMRQAGFSEATAKNPDKLTKSKAWPELMEKYLPREKIARVHGELLEANDGFMIDRLSAEKKYIPKPDNSARNRAVLTAYKLRGDLAAEKIELSRRKFQDMSDKELAESIAEAKKVLMKK